MGRPTFPSILKSHGFKPVKMAPEEIDAGEQWWTLDFDSSYIFLAETTRVVRINWLSTRKLNQREFDQQRKAGGVSIRQEIGGEKIFTHPGLIPPGDVSGAVEYLEELLVRADGFDERGGVAWYESL